MSLQEPDERSSSSPEDSGSESLAGKTDRWRPEIAQIFSGVGIGVLVGTLVGLSLAPVVGTLIAGLTALLAAFLGLSEGALFSKKESREDPRGQRVRELRAGSFGVACTLGLFLGLFIRTHNLLGVSVQDQFDAWTAIGFTAPEARQILLSKEIGWAGPEGESASDRLRPDHSVLYGTHPEECRNLNPALYRDTGEVLNAWRLQEPSPWHEVATIVGDEIPEEIRRSLVEAAWRLACGESE